jgi:predicted nucleic acid-binding protein
MLKFWFIISSCGERSMRKAYIDSNVFLDFWLGRKTGFHPVGEYAREFFRRALECEFELAISDISLYELRDNTPYKRLVEDFVSDFQAKRKLAVLKVSPGIRQAASKLARERARSFNDCVHLLLAKQTRAVLVTRDSDFDVFRGEVEIKKPEEL